jgi:integrase/recombinase XerD
MLHKNVTVRFYLKPAGKKVKSGHPIYCRVIYDRKKAELFTGEYVEPSKWSEESGTPIRNPRLQEYLLSIQEQILSKKRELEYQGRAISAKGLKEFYRKGDAKDTVNFLEYFDKKFEKLLQLPDEYAAVTLKKYGTSRAHFQRFLATIEMTDIRINEIDLKFIKEFDHFMRTSVTEQYGKLLTRNSVNSYHRKIKKVLGEAEKEGILSSNAYRAFKIKDEKTNRECLSQDELMLLASHPLGGNPSLDKVRDVFLFSCYTGLRYKDAQELRAGDVTIDGNGDYWLSFIQNKTGTKEVFPMLDPARELYHKYDHLREVTGFVLPKFSNAKINAYLKVIAGLTGIRKKLTHHVARHTFATTVTLANGVPLEMVSSYLGHADIRTTRVYAKITPELKLGVAKILNDKLKK